MLPHVDNDLRKRKVRTVSELNHATLHASWRHLIKRFPMNAGTVRSLERYLTAAGKITNVSKAVAQSVAEKLSDEYAHYLREVRGFAIHSMASHRRVSQAFLDYLDHRRVPLPIRPDTPLIWNAREGGRAYTGTGLLYCLRPLLKECGVRTLKGQPPRIHDLRHSFAVNALMRWYQEGADVESKLPLLATYLGHGSALSTHHYLHFIEPVRTAASERFARHFGALITPPPAGKGQRR
jgi:site-specific recombinase XerD